MEFQQKVLVTLSGIQARLQSIETHLKHATVLPPPGIDYKQTLFTEASTCELDRRMSSIETLLFRMHCDDYAKTDKIVDLAAAIGDAQVDNAELETETSPFGSKGVLLFNIFETGVDKITQTEDLDYAKELMDESFATNSNDLLTSGRAADDKDLQNSNMGDM